MDNRRLIGLVLGIAAFVVCLLLPESESLSRPALAAAGVVLLMSIWWITEALPIYATALVPLVLYPIFKILPASQTAGNYAHNYVLMMMGGFFLAKAIEAQNLHKRIALVVINFFGTSRRSILISMMLSTAFVSMWIANVTAAVMMYPIALSIVSREEDDERGKNFAKALMLCVAYASTLGGLGTLIGTPTNLILVGIMENLFPDAPPITFFTWLKVGLPVMLLLLPIFCLYLIRHFKIDGDIGNSAIVIKEELKALGAPTAGEKRVVAIVLLAVVGWVFREDIDIGFVIIPGWASLTGLDKFVHDSTVSIAASLLVFSISAGNGKRLLDWKLASTIPWGVLLIVGGGYAIAAGFESTGLARWLGAALAFVNHYPFLIVLVIIIGFVIIFTEFNSNTATANILLPILASMAVAAGTNPLILMIPATIASSLGFMMPAGTGSNSVIFGSERVTVAEMVRCGIWLNLISLVVVTLALYFVIIPWLHLEQGLPVWANK